MRTGSCTFVIVPSAMFESFKNMGDGVYIHSRQNAVLLKITHSRVKPKTTHIFVRQMLFVDDSAMVNHSVQDILRIVDSVLHCIIKVCHEDQHQKTELIFELNSTQSERWT